MGTKREKRKAGGARQSSTTFLKKLKSGERVRHKKGAPTTAHEVSRTSPELRGLSTAILNFNSHKIVLECGTQFTRLVDNLEVFHTCTKAKGHDGFHGFGNGLDIER